MDYILKPCAHCNSTDVELRKGTAHMIVCNNCGCRTGVVWMGPDKESNEHRIIELIAVWNRRDYKEDDHATEERQKPEDYQPEHSRAV